MNPAPISLPPHLAPRIAVDQAARLNGIGNLALLAGALARGDEAQQRLGEQGRVADADEAGCEISGYAWGEVGRQQDGCGLHASSSAPSSKSVLTVCA